jgi:SAM-dependent methyltransferase
MGLMGSVRKNLGGIYLKGRYDCDALGEQFLQRGPAAPTLLDVGCGSGELTLRWAKAARAEHIIGLEFVESEIEKAKRNGIDARKADLSMRWPVADAECDAVISSQNIEHMHRTMFYLAEMARVLKPGGRAIILTENLASWANIAALVCGFQPFSTAFVDGQSIGCPFSAFRDNVWDGDEVQESSDLGITGVLGHVRVMAFSGLSDAVEKTGLKVRTYRTSGYAPFWGTASRFASRVDPRHAHFLALEAVKPATKAAQNGVAPVAVSVSPLH